MQISEDKYAIFNESVFLPSFSLEAMNSLSTFSVKISNKQIKSGKFSHLLKESPNHTVKDPSKHNILSPTLPPYYYTSTFPSLFATFSTNKDRKLKETIKGTFYTQHR